MKYTDPSGYETGSEDGDNDTSGDGYDGGAASDEQNAENNTAGRDNTNDYNGEGDTSKSRAAELHLWG